MSVPVAARRFARVAARRPSIPARRSRLAIEPLEDRAVPANSLFIADHATADEKIDVDTVGTTTTIATLGGGAVLSLTTIEAALQDPAVTNVVVTTAVAAGGTDDDEFGNIDWDESLIGESLDFTNFGTGKTLTFRTAAGDSAIGNINLIGVHFLNSGTDDQISLTFDSSAANGIVTFDTSGPGSNTVIYSAEAVHDLTVNAGTGDFVFHDDGKLIGAADTGGAVSISAGTVDISHQGGLTAGATMSVSGTEILLDIGTGLLATGNLSVTGTSSVSADTGGLTSETGALTVTAPDVTLTQMILLADGDLTVTGDNSVQLTTSGFSEATSSRGDVRITGGTVDLPATFLRADTGNVTVSGTDVTTEMGVQANFGVLTITGTNSVVLTNTTCDFADGLTITGGTVTLNGSILLLLDRGDVAVTGTDVTLTDSELLTNEGKMALTGTNIVLDNSVLAATGVLTVAGPVTLGPGANAVGTVAPSTVTFTGPVDAQTAGEPNLEVSGGTVVFKQSIGATAGLNELNIRHGNTTVEGNTLNADSVIVFDPILGFPGDSNLTVPATLGINGTVTGNVTVKNTFGGRGSLAPGGLSKVGTMTVRGDVTLDGDFELDLSVTPGGPADLLHVIDNPNTVGTTEGNITIGLASNLGLFGVGQVPGNQVVVIDAATPVVGQFANAPLGAGLLMGTDYARVKAYTPDVVIEAMPAQGKVVKGVDEDGTLYTATLTGPGTLVHGKDNSGQRFLVVRDGNAASKLAITTKANGSDDVVTFGAGILVNYSLASMTAPKVNIGSQFRSSGAVALATFRDFPEGTGPGIALGGNVLNKTSITARNIFDDVKIGATLTALKVAQSLGAPFANPFAEPSKVTAPAIGTITAKAGVADVTTAGKLGTMTITGDYSGVVTAAAIGKFRAAGGSATLHATGANTPTPMIGSVGSVVSTGPNGMTLDVIADKVTSVNVAGSLITTDDGWNVKQGIATLTAGMLSANITAGYLGTVLIKGNLTTGLSGDIQVSRIIATGNSGPATGSFGIKSLTAKGTVDNSLFDVKAGNVRTFTVGRFHNSQLYLNYTPHDFSTEAFNTGGSFGAQGFKLGTFKTTAVPLGDPGHPLNWAFKNSEIAADKVGTITLSGLQTDNGGTPFGIKVRSSPAVVKVLAADAVVPLTLTPDSTPPFDDPIAGDFYFIDV
ncbi:MAG TPA: hypothetical protein VKD90_29885 [Gemmataceae bacterium]|nr:hypothetical protein [Gemmataceae bacterium]